MKKLTLMSLIIPITLITGIVLSVAGNSTGNGTLAQVGVGILSYGMPAVMFILVVTGLVLMMTGKLSDGGKKQNGDVTFGTRESSAAEEEAEKIANINSSYGYDSKIKLAEYQMEQSANAYKHSGKGDRIKGWLLFGFLMTDFALILVFAFTGIMIGCLVCFGLFAGTILLCLIVKIILEKTSMSGRANPDKYEQKSATVKACVMSSMGSTGGANNSSTVRVRSVTYRIILDVEGKEYNAYSGDVYSEGETITVWVRKNGGGLARIIDRKPDKGTDSETDARLERIAQIEKELEERSVRFETLEGERAEGLHSNESDVARGGGDEEK